MRRPTRPSLAAPSPLGEHALKAFMRDHWQRRPLVIRNAVDVSELVLPSADLFALAKREDVEARLVSQENGSYRLTPGPVNRFPSLKRPWTVLVQGVNLHDARFSRLLERFAFLPYSRLDDVMISYATDGGGVGAHVDSYDVFLLQLEGQRQWRISDQTDLQLIEGAPLRLLADFRPTECHILNAGDMLYLPPNYAHEGTAIGACMTASIGFRAPGRRELLSEYLFELASSLPETDRFTDAGRKPTQTPGRLDESMVSWLLDAIGRLSHDRASVAEFLGRYLTEPKPLVDYPDHLDVSIGRFRKQIARNGIALVPATQLLYEGQRLYINGEAERVRAAETYWFRTLADERRLGGNMLGVEAPDTVVERLHRWHAEGWIRYGKDE